MNFKNEIFKTNYLTYLFLPCFIILYFKNAFIQQSTISTVPLDKNAKKKQSKRTEAFQRIIKNDVSGEIETDMKLVKRGKNVIQKMESKRIIILDQKCMIYKM